MKFYEPLSVRRQRWNNTRHVSAGRRIRRTYEYVFTAVSVTESRTFWNTDLSIKRMAALSLCESITWAAWNKPGGRVSGEHPSFRVAESDGASFVQLFQMVLSSWCLLGHILRVLFLVFFSCVPLISLWRCGRDQESEENREEEIERERVGEGEGAGRKTELVQQRYSDLHHKQFSPRGLYSESHCFLWWWN